MPGRIKKRIPKDSRLVRPVLPRGNLGAGAGLEGDNRARERPHDAFDGAELVRRQLGDLVHVPPFGEHDDVVRTGHVVRADYAVDATHLPTGLTGLAHLGLDEDVGLYHSSPPFLEVLIPDWPRNTRPYPP